MNAGIIILAVFGICLFAMSMIFRNSLSSAFTKHARRSAVIDISISGIACFLGGTSFIIPAIVIIILEVLWMTFVYFLAYWDG